MSELFDDAWVAALREKWNHDPDMTGPLSQSNFNSTIAFGLIEETDPRVVIEVLNGRIEHAQRYRGGPYSAEWDLRATPATWAKWKVSGLGLTGVGVAVNSGALEFRKGDYRKLIRTPSLAGPFLKFFSLL